MSEIKDIQSEYIAEKETEIQQLRNRVEKLEEFTNSVVQWSKAYPKHIFTEPTPEQVDDVCKSLGFRIDRIAAMVLRDFVEPWGKRATEALNTGGKDE